MFCNRKKISHFQDKFSTFLVSRNFKRLAVELPAEFIDLPEMLYRSLDLKKKLEASLKIDFESEGTSDDSDEVALTESISSLATSLSIQSNDDHIIQLLQDQ